MKKDIKFSTRMASEDREAIKELAKRSGMSMSDYVTHCCLGRQVVIIDGLKDVLKELKSIGRNLNQLVKRIFADTFILYPAGEKWHSPRHPPPAPMFCESKTSALFAFPGKFRQKEGESKE